MKTKPAWFRRRNNQPGSPWRRDWTETRYVRYVDGRGGVIVTGNPIRVSPTIVNPSNEIDGREIARNVIARLDETLGRNT